MKSRRADGCGGSIGEGIRAASRDLGIERTEAWRVMERSEADRA
jgi:hypothetical protein